jgi:hypothetical protein
VSAHDARTLPRLKEVIRDELAKVTA